MGYSPVARQIQYRIRSCSREGPMKSELQRLVDLGQQWTPAPGTPSSDPPVSWTRVFFKEYPRFPSHPLRSEPPALHLVESLERRRSDRSFSARPIPFGAMSTLLHYSAGLRSRYTETDRFYPSAGARYPLEVYLLSSTVDEIKPGLYHYSILGDSLEELVALSEPRSWENVFGPEVCADSPSFLVITSVLSRSAVKYGTNAYRLSLLEAGHIGGNLCLLATSLGLAMCPLGGFDRTTLNRLLDLDDDEVPMYCFALGLLK